MNRAQRRAHKTPHVDYLDVDKRIAKECGVIAGDKVTINDKRGIRNGKVVIFTVRLINDN